MTGVFVYFAVKKPKMLQTEYHQRSQQRMALAATKEKKGLPPGRLVEVDKPQLGPVGPTAELEANDAE